MWNGSAMDAGYEANVSNASTPDYHCGTPATMSVWLITLLSTLYSLTVVIGAVGNGIVVWIVLGHRYMRTVTNYFLLNLAISDFLNVTLNVPFVYAYIMNDNTWVFGAVYCKVQTFMGYSVLSTIVLTFMAMALERYVAIIYPLKKRLSRKATLAVMLVVWLLSFALAIPAAYYANTFIRDTRVVCIAVWPDTDHQFQHDVVLMVINYCLPVCVTCFAYTRVALVLWRSKQIGECTREQQDSTNTKRKVVKMFITVVVVFTLCWLPFHSYFVLSHTHPDINCLPYSSIMYLLIFWVAMTNSACNPVIYFACNKRFRYNLIYVFRWCPFVKVTKLQEAIARDGVSTATTVYKQCTLGAKGRESRQILLPGSRHKRSSANDNIHHLDGNIECARRIDADGRMEMTELVSFDDNENNADIVGSVYNRSDDA